MSNSQRVTKQLLAMPVTLGAMAALAWPASYIAASHTQWLSTGSFSDFWTGAVAVVAFLCATVTTIACAGFTIDSVHRWFNN